MAITRNEGLATKLTGAGGGGCAFTLLGCASRPLERHVADAVERARAKIEARGYTCFEAVIGGHGALWHLDE